MQDEPHRFDKLKAVFAQRYEFIRIIGSGGFAEVYQARDKLLERDVAIKILLDEHAQESAIVERFLREAKLYAKLEHPHIIPIYDTGISEGNVFIVMKFIDGNSLKSLLQSQGKIPLHLLPRITRGIASALDYIHCKGIIHRDIKPGNIIIEHQTQNVYLADFGIARTDASETLTHSGMIVGTPFYLSPEQIKGKMIDSRSDIYSLGATLYELVTGEPPFHGASALEILYQHINENPKAISSLAPDIPAAIEKIISLCIEKDPRKRFQSAAEIVRLLSVPAEIFPGKGARFRPATRSQFFKISAVLVGVLALILIVNLTLPKRKTHGSRSEVIGPSSLKATLQPKAENQPAQKKETLPTSSQSPEIKVPVQQENKTGIPESKPLPVVSDRVRTSAPRPGTVRFSTFPANAAADIYLFTKKIGNTEQAFAEKYPPGEYTFRFVIPDYMSAAVKVTVQSGKTVRAYFQFPPFKEYIINSTPFGRLHIDGRDYGNTPCYPKLFFGTHELRFEKKGYKSERMTLTVEANSSTNIAVKLIKEGQP